MKTMQIVIKGVSEKQIQQDIKRMTKGWRLFMEEPSNANYTFINTFWGIPWDGTEISLREVMSSKPVVNGHRKHCLWIFRHGGNDRFAYCTWTRQLYDFNTKEYHVMEPKIATSIANTISTLSD